MPGERPWWRCQWCGENCPRWDNDVCPLRPQQLPRPGAVEKKWKAPPKEEP